MGYFPDIYFIFWTFNQLYTRHCVSFEVFFRTDSINQPEVSTCNPLRTLDRCVCLNSILLLENYF